MAILTIADFKNRSIMPSADVDRLRSARWDRRVADASAAAVSLEQKFAEVVDAGAALSILLVTRQSVVADGANYATITVAKRTAGGAPVTIGQLDTSTTTLPAGVPVAVPISAPSVSAEDVLTVAIAKAGTGVVVPQLELDVRLSPNFIDLAVAAAESEILDQLRKRYDVTAIAANPNETVKRWIAKLATLECYERRGFNPTSEQDRVAIIDSAQLARDQVAQAANSQTGLFELPLLPSTDPDAVTKGGPLGYSETSPYAWTTVQAEAGRADDRAGRGS